MKIYSGFLCPWLQIMQGSCILEIVIKFEMAAGKSREAEENGEIFYEENITGYQRRYKE